MMVFSVCVNDTAHIGTSKKNEYGEKVHLFL